MNKAMLAAVPEFEVEPEVRLVDVTPRLAQEWLGLNTSNRRVKTHQVVAYANDMRAGLWRMNGEAIKFSGHPGAPGELLDGQHRLYAVMKSKVTVQMLVVFGVAKGDQVTMDSGAKRSVADDLVIAGHQNSTAVASAAMLALRVQHGRLAGGGVFTNAAVRAFVDDNPELEDSASVAARYARRTDVPMSKVAYSHWVWSRIDVADATAFWRDAAEKAGLVAGDPVLALTDRFADARRKREQIPHAAQLSMIFRAWNARREGKTLRFLRMNSSRGLIEIPEPK